MQTPRAGRSLRVFAASAAYPDQTLPATIHACAYFMAPNEEHSVRVTRYFVQHDGATSELTPSASYPFGQGFKSQGISVQLATALFRSTPFKLFKTRYRSDSEVAWTIDRFLLDNEPLVLAYAKSVAALPEWFRHSQIVEVSDNHRFAEANLVRHPYQKWSIAWQL